MRPEVTSLHGDACRGDISAWMWPPCSNDISCGHPWSVLPQERPFGLSLWAVPSGGGRCTRSLLGAGRTVGHQRCNSAFAGAARVPSLLQPQRQRARLEGAPQPGSPSAKIGARNMLLPWQGCFLPTSLLPNKHPCQNS